MKSAQNTNLFSNSGNLANIETNVREKVPKILEFLTV